jgi:hypothetical protein
LAQAWQALQPILVTFCTKKLVLKSTTAMKFRLGSYTISGKFAGNFADSVYALQ